MIKGKRDKKALTICQVKNIVHVWEIGYVASSLISAAMIGSTLTHSAHHTTLLIMLDLSRPELLWITFEEILSAVRSALKMSHDAKLINEMIERRTSERKSVEKMIDLLPFKTFIIGGKYDEFQVIFDINFRYFRYFRANFIIYRSFERLRFETKRTLIQTRRR